MRRRDVVVVGASAGGVEALMQLVAGLPEDLNGAVFVALHMPEERRSVLPSLLSRSGPLPARFASEDGTISGGTITVVPPDVHLIFKGGEPELVRGPKENGARPAIDPMFRTAAREFGGRVVGVILSGAGDDGASGMSSIKHHGGTTIVQDPDEAAFPTMPMSAIESTDVDHVVGVKEMGKLIGELSGEESSAGSARGRATELDAEGSLPIDHSEPSSSYTCPECGGALWEIEDNDVSRFVCRVGHSFSPGRLLQMQADALEATLWTALRAIEERADLARQLGARMRRQGNELSARHFEERAERWLAEMEPLRAILTGSPVAEDVEAASAQAAHAAGTLT